MKLSTLKNHLATRASKQTMAHAIAERAKWSTALNDVRAMASPGLVDLVKEAGTSDEDWRAFLPTVRAAGDTDMDVVSIARALYSAREYSAARVSLVCGDDISLRRVALSVAVTEGLRTPREFIVAAHSTLALASVTAEAEEARAFYRKAEAVLLERAKSAPKPVHVNPPALTSGKVAK